MRRWTNSRRVWLLAATLAIPTYLVQSVESAGGATMAGFSHVSHENQFDWTSEMAEGTTLRVFTFGGTVTVERAAGRQARVRGDAGDAGRGDIEFLTERDGGNVRICAVLDDTECTDEGIRSHSGRGWPRGERDGRAPWANFTIEVPRGVIVRVSSGNGDVTIDGATTDVYASSGNGRVSVGPGAARVHASSGNGAVQVDGASGAVRASTGNGRVTVGTAAGPVNASTGRGNIDVSIASLQAEGDMQLTTGSGSITLRVPADFSADIRARTGNGGFETDFPLRLVNALSRNRMEGTIGNGGRNVRLSSGTGSIRVLRVGS